MLQNKTDRALWMIQNGFNCVHINFTKTESLELKLDHFETMPVNELKIYNVWFW